jgi:hypothetical protein
MQVGNSHKNIYFGHPSPLQKIAEIPRRGGGPKVSPAPLCRSTLLPPLKLAPTLDAERIESLKRMIPDIGEMSETMGEKNLPRIFAEAET